MIAAALLLWGAIYAPLHPHHGRMHATSAYYCQPQEVCSWSEGYCPTPYSSVNVTNMADETYGNLELQVTVTRLATATAPNSPVEYYIQWINPTNKPLLIKGPWLGAYGECLK